MDGMRLQSPFRSSRKPGGKRCLPPQGSPIGSKPSTAAALLLLAGGQRGRTGTLGESLALEYEYRFLVRQGDWERAREILAQPQ